MRPVRPGYSVGHFKITAGTIGAGCYDLSPLPGKPTRYYILSNNHVLANSNAAALGDPIYQPGPFDGGGPADAIGRLARYVPITFDGSCNYVDAAIAEVPFDAIDRDIYWSGYPTTAATGASVGQLVKKTGRTTHFTTGRVTAVNATVNVGLRLRRGGEVLQPDHHDRHVRRRRQRVAGARLAEPSRRPALRGLVGRHDPQPDRGGPAGAAGARLAVSRR